MITIYQKNEIDFTHRGLGILTDATEAEVQEEINGIYDLRVTYPKNGRNVDLIEEERIVKASTPKGDQFFRISHLRKDLDFIEVHALHLFYDLSWNFVEDTFIQNKGGQAALQQVLDMSLLPHSFTAISDVPGPMNLRMVRYNTVHAMMGDDDNTLLSRYGGELERDNHVIGWKQKLGDDRGVKIKYRKNLLGIDFETDYSMIVTRMMPQGFDGLFLPEKYVDSPRINDYHMPKIQKREYPVISAQQNPDEEGAIPHDQALARLRTLAAEDFSEGLDLPQITCFVDFVDLAQTEEYKEYQVLERIYIGDTVRVIYPEQKIEVSARMTRYTWDALKHRYSNLLIGTDQNELRQSLSSGEKALSKAEEVQQSMMEKAREVATNLINAGFGGHVRIYPDRILIMDTEEEATAVKVWQWNMAGLGYSSTGINGSYGTAMTSNGQIVGSFIAANSITANQLAADVGQSLDLSSNVAITSRVTKSQILTDREIQAALKGAKGDPGQQGIPGSAGTDGQTTYTWIRWANTPTTGMSATPDGKDYIGIAYNKNTQTPSNNYSDYLWSLTRGRDGIPGAEKFTWVKYANDINGTGMSDSPDGRKFIGMAFNKETNVESTNASDYQWSSLYGEAVIISDTAPTTPNAGQIWLDTSVNPPVFKRWNNVWEKVNDVSNIILSLENKVDSATMQELLESLRGTILTDVQTKFEQTESDFTFSFSSMQTLISHLESSTNIRFEETEKFIRFEDGKIIIGIKNDPFSLSIANNRISFINAGAEVAYISDNRLYITDGHFINSLRVGNFGFFPEENGSLTFRKV